MVEEKEEVEEEVLHNDEPLFSCNLGADDLTASTAGHRRWRRWRGRWWRHSAGFVYVLSRPFGSGIGPS